MSIFRNPPAATTANAQGALPTLVRFVVRAGMGQWQNECPQWSTMYCSSAEAERFEYGYVAAQIGLILGAGIAIAVFLFSGSASWYAIIFSAIFFSLLGFVRGKLAGDFRGLSKGATLEELEAQPGGLLEVAITLAYLLGEIFLTRLN